MTGWTFIAGLAIISAALSLIMAGGWLIWRMSRNSGWVDTIWTFGVGAVGCVSALLPLSDDVSSMRSHIVAAMATIWSLRLGLHIAQRTTGITDDPRYAKLIHDWGMDAPRQMFWLLQKQAVVSIPLGVAIWLAAHNPAPFGRVLDVIGILIFAIAVGGEAIADQQLRRFRSDPNNHGRVCDVGLWGWSRHPNYFFEWLGWLAYPVLALNMTGNYPWEVVAFAAPACMYWLLVHISGIPPLEEHMLERRGDAFRAYQMRTNAFFPGPPKTQTGD